MIPRDYQIEAAAAPFRYFERGGPGSPLIEMATGAGKSLCLAMVARRLVEDHDARVVVVTHRKELIEQDARAIRTWWPDAPLGVFSAGLASRRIDRVTVAGIQSVWRRPELWGHVDIVQIDECHLLSQDAATMYGKFLSGLRAVNPDLRLIGWTATPYRVGQGLLTQGEGALFNAIVYRTDIKRLIADGWLSPLVVPSNKQIQIDTTNARTQSGDWVQADLALTADLQQVNTAVADDVAREFFNGRTSILVFGVNVQHAEHLRDEIRSRGLSVEVVVGEAPDRARILDRFKSRQLTCICSCDVLTTGFDAPVTDVIALVRPTQSPGLYVQMLGRGMRRADSKESCCVLDYGGNIARHGPITDVRQPEARRKRQDGLGPVKTCPQCMASVPAGRRQCVHCDYEFPPPEKTANADASRLDPMGSEVRGPAHHDIQFAECEPHVGKQSGRPTLRVRYVDFSWQTVASEYICLEHDGYARQKAEGWWRVFFPDRPVPATIDEGMRAFRAGHMRAVKSIEVVWDGRFQKVKRVEFDENKRYKPHGRDAPDDQLLDDAVMQPEPIPATTTTEELTYDDDIPF